MIEQYEHLFTSGWTHGRVGSSLSTSDANRVLSHEWGMHQIVITGNRICPWSFVTQLFRNGEPGNHNTFEVVSSTVGSATSLLAATIYQENHEAHTIVW
jgi:hypothetical protein